MSMSMGSGNGNDKNSQNSPRVPSEEETKWGSLKFELHWQTPAEEMNEQFKRHYGVDYPVNRAELIDLVVKKVIRDIEEARDFVIDKMQGNDFLKSYNNPRLAIFELEQTLAVRRGGVCDLPQYKPGQYW